MKHPEIIFEDNHIIAVNKPDNMLSQADTPDDKNDALNLTKEYIKVKYEKPGNVFLGLVHRLDRNTTGVLVFAKTSKAASRLSESIRKGAFTKTYNILINGCPKILEGTIKAKIEKDEENRKASVSNKGKEAITHYKVLEKFKYATLLEVQIETGRFHQIRVHFAHMGHPLLSDNKYGGKKNSFFARPAIHALRAEFQHPTREEQLIIEAPLPDDFEKFLRENRKEALKALEIEYSAIEERKQIKIAKENKAKEIQLKPKPIKKSFLDNKKHNDRKKR